MTQELLAKIAAIITTLAEKDIPESSLYIAICKTNLNEWNFLRAIMIDAKLISIKHNLVSLTEHGKDVALKIESKMVQA